LKDQETNIAANGCNCKQISASEINIVVDQVIAITGGGKEKVIEILQEVQKRLNYLPSEALKHICNVTDITPGQISGVSTFYSQFRHLPVGKHTVKICSGTACHVKGAPLISDAFKRVLHIDDTINTSPDNLFSIEEVACLGCCTLAPLFRPMKRPMVM
jgi:NADH:ubiquinone oxidoreductase subunit E